MFEGGGFVKKKKQEEAELDITPMIDVTFLLLIFFMVTSTMQATPDRDIPPSGSGANKVMKGKVEITVRSGPGDDDGEVELGKGAVSLDQLKADLLQMAASGDLSVMIFCERDVRNGALAEVEAIVGEVAKDSGKEIEMAFAVKDKR